VPERPYLVEASGWLNDWQVDERTVSFRYAGWGQGEAIIGGFKPGTKIKAAWADQQFDLTADQDGRVLIKGFGQTQVSLKADIK